MLLAQWYNMYHPSPCMYVFNLLSLNFWCIINVHTIQVTSKQVKITQQLTFIIANHMKRKYILFKARNLSRFVAGQTFQRNGLPFQHCC
jgi:hypothetical protein